MDIECFKLLKLHQYKLNKQQYKTLKGQIKSGDFIGFKKGLSKIIKKGRNL